MRVHVCICVVCKPTYEHTDLHTVTRIHTHTHIRTYTYAHMSYVRVRANVFVNYSKCMNVYDVCEKTYLRIHVHIYFLKYKRTQHNPIVVSVFLCVRVYDVGGQRGERRKWLRCFENVLCLLLITSLSGM